MEGLIFGILWYRYLRILGKVKHFIRVLCVKGGGDSDY